MITLSQFKKVLPTCREPDVWHSIMEEELHEWGIVSHEQVCAFLAQTAHESSSFNVLAENLNYSADRLKVIFPKYFKDRDVTAYHRNPEAIANLVYSNRMGNGSPDSGDGYRYRGRGILQVTGKSNYMHCSLALFGQDDVLVDAPDLLLHKPNALGSALWFWQENGLEKITNFNVLTKRINGGLIGQPHREELFKAFLNV